MPARLTAPAPDAADLAVGGAAPTRQQRQLRWAAVSVIVLLLAAAGGFVWYERAEVLDNGHDLALGRADFLARDIQQALETAGIAIRQAEQQLRATPAGSFPTADQAAVAIERAQLLTALEIPFELHAVDASGRSIALAAASPNPPEQAHLPLQALPDGGRWAVGLTTGAPDRRVLPLQRRAAPNAHGIVAFEVDLLYAPLVSRLAADRLAGGGVALFRVEPGGQAVTLLARAPLAGSKIGQRIQGPLLQALQTAPRGSFQGLTQIDNVHRIVAYRRLDGGASDLVVAYGIDTAALLRPRQGELPWLAALTLLLAGVLGHGARRLDRSLAALAVGHQRLQASEEHFRGLADNLPDVVARVDADGRYLYMNAACLQATGHPPAHFIGKTAEELGMPSATDDLWSASRRRVFASGRPERVEASLEGPQGTRVWESNVVPETDASGQVRTMLVISRNVTGRHRLEHALRAREQQLSHLLSTSPAVIYTARAEGDYAATYVSDNIRQLSGYSPGEFTGNPSFWVDHVHPDDRDRVVAALAGMEEGRAVVVEYRFLDSEGQWRWMRDESRLARPRTGAAPEVIGSRTDITERHEAEDGMRRLAAELERRVEERTAQLEVSERRYRTIFEGVPISIGEEDWSGVQRLLRGLRASGVTDGPAHFAAHPEFVARCLEAVRIVRLNRKALALHDARSQHQDLPDLRSFYPTPDLQEQFVGEIEAMWAGRKMLTARRSLPAVSGRPLSLMLTMSLPDLDDEADSTALVCLVDLTGVDRLHGELAASLAHLSAANSELETFTYSVSHDLRAPLRAIDGLAAVLQQQHAGVMVPEARRLLDLLRQSAQQLDRLIVGLLDFARTARELPKRMRVDPGPLVRHCVKDWSTEISERGIVVRVGELPPCDADPMLLRQVFANLIANAVKYTRKQPQPRIEIGAETRPEGTVYLVRDNGAGFDMGQADKLFTVFHRLHRAEEYEGTGVGLAIVLRIVQRHGGRVWAQSAPGEGATFFFTVGPPVA